MIPDVVGVFIEAKVSLTRIVKLLEAPELENRNTRQKCNGKELEHSIFIRATEISWETNLENATLRNINLVVKQGEKVAICGEVGTGKSTLLAAILGEVPNIKGIVSNHFIACPCLIFQKEQIFLEDIIYKLNYVHRSHCRFLSF